MFIQNGVEARCWYAEFQGEGSIDAGGPFRDSLDNIAKELESSALPLLIKSPNNRNDHGYYRDAYIFNPDATSPICLQMITFFGGLVGYAIMSTSALPIYLAPIIWKTIVGENLTIDDLKDFDEFSSSALEEL